MASTIYEECKECKKSNLEKLYYNRLLKLLDMVEDEED